MKSDEEVQSLVTYVNWYGGFKDEAKAITWLDENQAGWRTVRDTKINYIARIGDNHGI